MEIRDIFNVLKDVAQAKICLMTFFSKIGVPRGPIQAQKLNTGYF